MPYGNSATGLMPLLLPSFAPPQQPQAFDFTEYDALEEQLRQEAALQPVQDDGLDAGFMADQPVFRPRARQQPGARFDFSQYDALERQLEQEVQQQPYLKPNQPASYEKFADDNSDLVEKYQQADREMKAENPGSDWIKYFAKRSIPGFSTGYQIADLESARRAADKLETEPLSNEDAYALAKLLNEMEDDQKRTGLKQAGNVLAELPAFAGELLATAGTGSLARVAVTKALTKLVARRAAKKTVGRFAARQAIGATAKTAQVATQTALQPLQMTKNTLNRNVRQTLAGERESLGISALHGVGQTALETATEMLVGKAIQGLVGKGKGFIAAKLAEKTPTLDKLRQRLVERWVANKSGRTLADGWKKVADQAGWNGMLGEIGEERVNEIALGLAGELGATGSEYDFGATGKLASGKFGAAYADLWPEMVAFAIPGSTMMAAGGVANYYGLGKGKQQRIDDYLERPDSERLYRQAVDAGMPAMPSPLSPNRENRINHAKALQQAAVDAAQLAAEPPQTQEGGDPNALPEEEGQGGLQQVAAPAADSTSADGAAVGLDVEARMRAYFDRMANEGMDPAAGGAALSDVNPPALSPTVPQSSPIEDVQGINSPESLANKSNSEFVREPEQPASASLPPQVAAPQQNPSDELPPAVSGEQDASQSGVPAAGAASETASVTPPPSLGLARQSADAGLPDSLQAGAIPSDATAGVSDEPPASASTKEPKPRIQAINTYIANKGVGATPKAFNEFAKENGEPPLTQLEQDYIAEYDKLSWEHRKRNPTDNFIKKGWSERALREARKKARGDTSATKTRNPEAASQSLFSIIKNQFGFIDAGSVDDAATLKENVPGLKFVIRERGPRGEKRGWDFDVIAYNLEGQGDLRVPDNWTAPDWLMEQLRRGADSANAVYSDKYFAKKEAEERKAVEDARQHNDEESEIEASLRSGEAEGIRAADEAADRGDFESLENAEVKAGESVDTSFDFGEPAFSLQREPAKSDKPPPMTQGTLLTESPADNLVQKPVKPLPGQKSLPESAEPKLLSDFESGQSAGDKVLQWLSEQERAGEKIGRYANALAHIDSINQDDAIENTVREMIRKSFGDTDPKIPLSFETEKWSDFVNGFRKAVEGRPESDSPIKLESVPKAAVTVGNWETIKSGEHDLRLAISKAANHYTLWYQIPVQPGRPIAPWRYVRILGGNKAEAHERAKQAADRIAAGDLTGLAFIGKEQIALPKSIGLINHELGPEQLMAAERAPIGEQPVGFGKYRDTLVKDLFAKDPGYAQWLADSGSTGRGKQVAEYLSNHPDLIASRDADIAATQDAMTPESIEILKGHGITPEALSRGGIALRGKTYDWKDFIKSIGGKFSDGSWIVSADQYGTVVAKLGGIAKPAGGQRGGVPAYESNPGLGELRRDADQRPDTSGFNEPITQYISGETSRLIERGRDIGMPEVVVNEQIEDVARINRAYQQGKKLFLLASEPGSGKTFVLGGAIRELQAAGAKRIVYVTLRSELISQIKSDLKDYGIDGVEFITYPAMRTSEIKDTDVLIFDEAHSIKNVGKGDESAQQAAKAAEWIGRSKFTVLSTATPFENPVQAQYLQATGVFDKDFDGFRNFALAYGASTYTLKNGDDVMVWKRTASSDRDAAAAREYFRKEGIFTSRRIRLPENQVDSRLVKVNVDAKAAETYAAFSAAAAENQDSLAGFGAAWVVNFQKRLLEAAKVQHGIREAEAALKRGRFPILFVETKAERNIDIPELIEAKQRWEMAVSEAMKLGDKPPARSEFGVPPPGVVETLASFMDTTGTSRIEIPSAEDIIKEHFGDGKVAIFTGSVTPTKAQKNLDAWRRGDKPVLVATMAKGGTGLSLHDKVGDHQTTQININLPWTATQVVQVAQRSARYGLKGQAEMQWIFADNIPFDRNLSNKVGGRMADMGAVVHGEKLKDADKIEDWNFENQPFSENAAAEPRSSTKEPSNAVPAGQSVQAVEKPAAEAQQAASSDPGSRAGGEVSRPADGEAGSESRAEAPKDHRQDRVDALPDDTRPGGEKLLDRLQQLQARLGETTDKPDAAALKREIKKIDAALDKYLEFAESTEVKDKVERVRPSVAKPVVVTKANRAAAEDFKIRLADDATRKEILRSLRPLKYGRLVITGEEQLSNLEAVLFDPQRLAERPSATYDSTKPFIPWAIAQAKLISQPSGTERAHQGQSLDDQEAAKKQELDDALAELKKNAKKGARDNLGAFVPLDAETFRSLVKVTKLTLELGGIKFRQYVQSVVQAFDGKLPDNVRSSLVGMWNDLGEAIPGLETATDADLAAGIADARMRAVETSETEAFGDQPVAINEPPGETGTTAAEMLAPGADFVSTQNKYAAKVREELGIPERGPVDLEGHTWDDLNQQAAEFSPDVAINLLAELGDKEKPARAVSDLENFILLRHLRGLQNQRLSAVGEIADAREKGDSSREALAQATLTALDQQLKSFVAITEAIGTPAGRLLAARKAFLAMDYSIPKLEYDIEQAQQRPMTPAEKTELADLHAKYEALKKHAEDVEAKYAEQQAQAAITQAITTQVAEQKNPASARKQKARVRFSTAFNIFSKEIATAHSFGSFTPEAFSAAVEMVKASVELGVATVQDFVDSVAKRVGKALTPELDAGLRKAWSHVEADSKSPKKLDFDPQNSNSLRRAAQEIMREHIAKGVTSRDALIDAVHEELKQYLPEITRREAMMAMSGYGDIRPATNDPIELVRQDVNGQIQAVLKLEDMSHGVAPLHSGQQRNPQSQEKRRLEQEVNEAKRKGGFVTLDPETQLKSTLQARETWLRHRMEDLRFEISKGTRTVKTKTPTPTSPAIEALQAEYELLKAEHEAVFGKRELTDKQKLEIATKHASKNEAFWADQLAKAQKGEFPAGEAKKPPITSPELEAIRSKTKAAQAEFKRLDDAAHPERKEDARYARAKANVEHWLQRLRDAQNGLFQPRHPKAEDSTGVTLLKSLAAYSRAQAKELDDAAHPERSEQLLNDRYLTSLLRQKLAIESKIASGDIAVKPKIERKLTPEVVQARHDREQAKAKLDELREKARLEGRTKIEKLKDVFAGAWDATRDLMTTGEASFLLRQGLLYAAGHPLRFLRATAKSFAVFSKWNNERELFQVNEEIQERPNAKSGLYARGKVPFSDSLGKKTGAEELLIGKWAERIPLLGRIIKRNAMAGDAFLNIARADMFDAMAASWSSDPNSVTTAEARVFGSAAGEFTGKGNTGDLATSVKWLNLIFFSSPFTLSRFQLVLAHPLWTKGSTLRTQKAVATEYVRAAIGLFVFYKAIQFALSAAGGDEDEEPVLEGNPLSSDFGKWRIGRTRLDPLAGIQQVAVLLARQGFNSKKTAAGVTVPLGGMGGRVDDARDVINNFWWSKVHPTPSLYFNLRTGRDLGGNPVTTDDVPKSMIPMSYPGMAEAVKETGLPRGLILDALAFTGAGLNTYGMTTKEMNQAVAMKASDTLISEDRTRSETGAMKGKLKSEYTGQHLEDAKQNDAVIKSAREVLMQRTKTDAERQELLYKAWMADPSHNGKLTKAYWDSLRRLNAAAEQSRQRQK